MKRWLRGGMALALAVGLLGMAASGAQAQERLLATVGVGVFGGGTTSALVELDPDTGASMGTIGVVGYIVNGMVWDPTTSTMYGGTSYTDPLYNGLITIDINTGAGTPIGVSGWGLSGFTAVTNLTVNAAGDMYGWYEGSDDLVRVDKGTGLATVVGEAGLSTLQNGLAFDALDVLYMVNSGGSYYTVNTSTGSTTFAGSIGRTAHHGVFQPSSGTYYGVDLAGGGPNNLILADLATGSVLAVLPSVDDLHTLAFTTAGPTATEAKTWGAVKIITAE